MPPCPSSASSVNRSLSVAPTPIERSAPRAEPDPRRDALRTPPVLNGGMLSDETTGPSLRVLDRSPSRPVGAGHWVVPAGIGPARSENRSCSAINRLRTWRGIALPSADARRSENLRRSSTRFSDTTLTTGFFRGFGVRMFSTIVPLLGAKPEFGVNSASMTLRPTVRLEVLRIALPR